MKKILNYLGLKIFPWVINLYTKTLNIKIYNKPNFKTNFIYIFWHSKMLIGWWLFKNKNFAALVSQSNDGEILTNILRKWNYKVVRGSSSKGGKEALRNIIYKGKENDSIVITPDGPRGPANEIKNGVFIISNECTIPIVPVKINYQNKKTLSKSWDKFEIPLPFSECEIHFGNKYSYEKYLEESELESLKKSISEEM